MNVDQGKLFAEIDRIPSLKGAGIAYIGDDASTVLRKSTHASNLQTYLILEESGEGAAVSVPGNEAAAKSRILPELLSMGLNCGSAVMTGLAVAGESAAAPITAGGSALLIYPTAAAAVATSLQCGVAVGRVFNQIWDPTLNDYLDSEKWYTTTSDVLDGICLVGAAASLGVAAQAAIRLQATSGRSFREILKAMNREERRRLARDVAKYANPATSNKQLKALIRAGAFPKIFNQAEVTQALKMRLFDAIATALTLGSSATAGLLKKAVTVHIFQE